MKGNNTADVAKVEIAIGEDDDQEVEERSVVLTKRTFVGPIAFVEKSASLDRSRDYGNKAHIGVKVTLPCYPNEVYDALTAIDDILQDEMERALKSVKEAAGNLVDAAVGSRIKTKRGLKREKGESKKKAAKDKVHKSSSKPKAKSDGS